MLLSCRRTADPKEHIPFALQEQGKARSTNPDALAAEPAGSLEVVERQQIMLCLQDNM